MVGEGEDAIPIIVNKSLLTGVECDGKEDDGSLIDDVKERTYYISDKGNKYPYDSILLKPTFVHLFAKIITQVSLFKGHCEARNDCTTTTATIGDQKPTVTANLRSRSTSFGSG